MKTKILKMLAVDALALVFLALVVAFAVWLGGCGGEASGHPAFGHLTALGFAVYFLSLCFDRKAWPRLTTWLLLSAAAAVLIGCGGSLPSGAADAAPAPVDAGVDAGDAGDAGGCRWVTDGVEVVLFCPDDGESPL